MSYINSIRQSAKGAVNNFVSMLKFAPGDSIEDMIDKLEEEKERLEQYISSLSSKREEQTDEAQQELQRVEKELSQYEKLKNISQQFSSEYAEDVAGAANAQATLLNIQKRELLAKIEELSKPNEEEEKNLAKIEELSRLLRKLQEEF